MKGTDVGVQEKEAKLINELQRFTYVEGESIESYYRCFAKLMNDLDRNQLTPKNIACNLKNHNGNFVAARAENNGMGTMKIRLDLFVDYSWPKVRESAFAKPHHMIAPGSFGYSLEESYGSNDMVYNYYLEEARKKTQERNRNFKPKEMHYARTHNTLHDYKPKPRSNNQTSRNWPASKSSDVTLKDVQKAEHSRNSRSYLDSKHFVCSRCQKCVFNANHDACVTTFLKEVNSYAKVQSHKTRNSNKLVEQKIHTHKPIRWKPTGRVFKTVVLRWVPTENIFASCTSKVVSEPTHGSNVDIFKIYKCRQTLDLSAGTSINVQKEQSIDLSVVDSKLMKENDDV
nr:hypothetical protein [Tanacetum cinerariifolium]